MDPMALWDWIVSCWNFFWVILGTYSILCSPPNKVGWISTWLKPPTTHTSPFHKAIAGRFFFEDQTAQDHVTKRLGEFLFVCPGILTYTTRSVFMILEKNSPVEASTLWPCGLEKRRQMWQILCFLSLQILQVVLYSGSFRVLFKHIVFIQVVPLKLVVSEFLNIHRMQTWDVIISQPYHRPR